MIQGITIKTSLLAAGCLFLAAHASQAENFFIPITGNWTNAANWTDGIVPTNSAAITDGSTAIYTGGGPIAAGHIFIGDSAPGTLSFNSGSLTNTATFSDYGFTVGINSGGSGVLTLAPSAGTLSVVPLVIGDYGADGHVTQNGGTVIVNDFFTMGLNASGTIGNTYQLYAGSLSVTGDFSVCEAWSTTDTFTQTGGTVIAHNIFIGRSGTGRGVYSISGGNIYATNDDLLVGVINKGANGTLNVSGTANINISGTVNGDLVVGADDMATGTADMVSGTVVANDIVVGRNGGTGTMIQSNGTVSTGGYMVLGLNGPPADGSAAYQMVGGTLNVAGDFSVNQDYGQTCTFTQSGGTINLTGTNSPTAGTTNGVNYVIGRSSVAGTGVYTISGGTLNIGTNGNFSIAGLNDGAVGELNVSGTASVNVGTNGSTWALLLGGTSESSATVNQSGGTVTIASSSTYGLWLGPGNGDGPAGGAAYNLNGGILILPAITPDSGGSVNALSFGGGTLRANGTFVVPSASGFTATLNVGGGTFDTAGFAISWFPALSGVGGLTKVGAGTLALGGANNYSGATLVSNGTLLVDGSIASPVTVASTATLGGSGFITGAVTVNGTLAPGDSDGSTLTISNSLVLSGSTVLSYTLGTTSDLTVVTGNLTLDGTINVVNGGGLAAGNYTLFKYGSLTDIGLTVNMPSGFSGTVSNDTGNSRILLVVMTTGANPFTTWQDHYFTPTELANPAFSGPNADPFGKGISNTNQFLAGFNPTNSAAYPHIISIVATNGNTKISYLASNGDTSYTGGPTTVTNVLEFTPGTANGSYSTNNFASTGLTNILSGGIGLGAIVNTTDVGGATNKPSRFYRIQILVP